MCEDSTNVDYQPKRTRGTECSEMAQYYN